MAAAVLFRPNATAQPPATVRTIAASPQGEWVAIQESGSDGAATNTMIGNDPAYEKAYVGGNFKYVVLYHTGTGKSRIVAWRDRNGIQNFMTFDTP